MDNFEKKEVLSFSSNLLNNILQNWLLITCGNINDYNMMTASWGTFGILWNKPIAQVFIRPSRYTFEYILKNDYFSISFFDSSYKDTLNILGSKSGRDFDKMNIEGLKAIDYEGKTVFFEQAKQVLICKKIYSLKMQSENIETDIKNNFYKNGDYHHIFYGEIVDFLKKI